jgi:uncharacterized membrane protein YfcA
MHIDIFVTLAGLIVGVIVGMTGMGGGALMTPILVLVFGVQPLAAVSSDLVASFVMKPIGASVHLRRKTVRWEVVRWLAITSVPFAFAGVFVLRAFGDADSMQNRVKITLGIALLMAAGLIVIKAALQRRQAARLAAAGITEPPSGVPIKVRPVPTMIIGAVGGLVVGMTSVGSGSLIIVALMIMYPTLVGKELVGTDLVQAVPLVAAAALGHILYGDFVLGLTVSLLIGCIPGVYIGARMSAKAPDGVVRPLLAFVLLASGLKLVNMGTGALGWTMLIVAIVGLAFWGAIDGLSFKRELWEEAGINRKAWLSWETLGAFFGVGAVAALTYFIRVRPQLVAKAHALHAETKATITMPEAEATAAV